MILKVSTVSCASKLNSFILSEFHTCIQCISFISLHTVALPISCGLMAPRPSLSPWAQPLCVLHSTAGAWVPSHRPWVQPSCVLRSTAGAWGLPRRPWAQPLYVLRSPAAVSPWSPWVRWPCQAQKTLARSAVPTSSWQSFSLVLWEVPWALLMILKMCIIQLSYEA